MFTKQAEDTLITKAKQKTIPTMLMKRVPSEGALYGNKDESIKAKNQIASLLISRAETIDHSDQPKL